MRVHLRGTSIRCAHFRSTCLSCVTASPACLRRGTTTSHGARARAAGVLYSLLVDCLLEKHLEFRLRLGSHLRPAPEPRVHIAPSVLPSVDAEYAAPGVSASHCGGRDRGQTHPMLLRAFPVLSTSRLSAQLEPRLAFPIQPGSQYRNLRQRPVSMLYCALAGPARTPGRARWGRPLARSRWPVATASARRGSGRSSRIASWTRMRSSRASPSRRR